MQREAAELSYGEILRILRGSWAIILAFTTVGALIAVAIALMMKPIYRAEVLLSPAAEEGGGGSALARMADQLAPLSSLIGPLDTGVGTSEKEIRIATLHSRRLTNRFISDKNLLPALFAQRWDRSSGDWKLSKGERQIPSIGEAFRLFDKKVRTVNEDRRTGLITLAIEWPDRRVVADWANDLVARANELMRARVIGEAQRSIAFLEDELKKTSVVERQQIIYRLIESKTGEIMMANARNDYAFVVVDPAVMPEPGQFVRPRRVLITAIGLLLGLFVGVIYAGVRWASKSSRSDSAVSQATS